MVSSVTELTNGRASGSLWDMTGRAQVITFIGAGGKTTCLRSITQELDSAGLRVIATTTTKVFPEEHIHVWEDPCYPPPAEQENACFWYAKAEGESGKWIGPASNRVDDAIKEDLLSFGRGSFHAGENGENADPTYSKRIWVIEGDGARGRKLKCWGPHEPQIPKRTDCAVLVLDGGLWGKVLQADQVHRPVFCPDLLGYVWKAERAWSYFLRSPVFARQYGHLSWVILLNSYGEDAENWDLLDPLGNLQDLGHMWTEIQQKAGEPINKPMHLRLAAGNAKEGKIKWFDLW